MATTERENHGPSDNCGGPVTVPLSCRAMHGLHRFLAVALLSAAMTASAVPARSTTRGPTRSQIGAAVRKAEGSKDLWATVNICNTNRHQDVIGIRAQMPALGFPAQLWMDFVIDRFSSASATFEPYPRATTLVRLGTSSQGDNQGGASFLFPSHAGLLRGRVTFEWRRGGRTIGRTNRITVAGHPRAMHGDPLHFSSAKCLIP